MLKTLAPTLKDKNITIMLSAIEGEKVSMILIPKSKKEKETDKTDMPLQIIGTIEEIENSLEKTMAEYKNVKTESGNNIAEYKKQVAAIEAAEKKKRDEKLAKNKKTKPESESKNEKEEQENDGNDLFAGNDKTEDNAA